MGWFDWTKECARVLLCLRGADFGRIWKSTAVWQCHGGSDMKSAAFISLPLATVSKTPKPVITKPLCLVVVVPCLRFIRMRPGSASAPLWGGCGWRSTTNVYLPNSFQPEDISWSGRLDSSSCESCQWCSHSSLHTGSCVGLERGRRGRRRGDILAR